MTELVACPGCGLELPEVDSAAQIRHMQAEHPEIIRARLRAIGEVEPGSEALTPALMRARVEILTRRNEQVGMDLGPADRVETIQRAICDRCRTVVDLRDGHPEGWTTDGDFTRGFVDLCRSCSQ